MRAAGTSILYPSPVFRYLTATLLLFTPLSHAGPPKLRQQAFGFTGWRRHPRARRHNTTGSNGRSNSTTSARRGSASISRAKFTTTGSATMSKNDDNRGGGGGTSGETGMSLPTFLQKCSSIARKKEQQQRGLIAAGGGEASAEGPGAVFHVFSGNEACDADSMCSAICMAFLKQNTAALPATTVEGDDSVLYVPVMPIPRADLALRREVIVLFELCGVDSSAVVFADELDLPALQAEGGLRLTLMDHNAVSGGLSELGGAVVEIIDHHADLGNHPGVQAGSRDIAFDASDGSGKALVGSCCTMVAERMLDQAPGLLSSDVARLLLGVILVDTINLDADAKRATERDVAAAEQLSHRVSWSPVTPESTEGGSSATTPDALFDTLRNAKFDPAFWKELSATDCLRYDYKSFLSAGESSGDGSGCDGGAAKSLGKPPSLLRFGMSSVLCRLETLAEKGGEMGPSDALQAFAVAQQVDSLAVMTSTLDPEKKMKKELLIFTHTKLRCDQMRKYFEGPDGEFLRLEVTAPPTTSFGGGGCSHKAEEDDGAQGWFLRWELGNVRPSRKQIAPAIASFYESISNGC